MNHPLATLFEQFLTERTYLKNVTPATLVWYQVAFKNYRASIADDAPPLPTKNTLQQFVIRQRERSIRPVTVNTYIGAMNAFCAWLHQEGHVAERVKQPKLRVENRVLVVLTEAQMRPLIAYKPTSLGHPA
jgi:site-specific recombinase XerD